MMIMIRKTDVYMLLQMSEPTPKDLQFMLILHFRQNFWTIFCDEDCVLTMGGAGMIPRNV